MIYEEVKSLQDMLAETVDAETGEIIKDREFDAVNALKQEVLDNGIARISKVHVNLQGQAEAIRAEIKRLQGKLKAVENNDTRLKGYVKLIFETSGVDKMITDTYKVSLRLSEAVNIYNEELLPDAYLRAVYEPDKKAIKDAIKSGATIEGAEIKTNVNVIFG